MRVLRLLLCLFLLLPGLALAQVLPPPGGGAGTPVFPVTTCVNSVATGMATDGVLTCVPVVPTMTSGLVPAGVDVSAAGQVMATHLPLPLPAAQGGTGLAVGTPGGLLYYPSATSLASTPAFALNAPLFGGGPGQPPVPGTRSGTTLQVGTVSGPLIPGQPLQFDVSGNIVAGTTLGGSAVSSVFGRTGAVVAQSGDYSAAQVTHAADLTVSNTFTLPQIMPQVVMPGQIGGSLTLRGPSVAGTSAITLPPGSIDFTATGGASQVVRQNVSGGPFSVSRLDFTDLTGTATICTTTTLCAGYQAALTFSTGLQLSGTTVSVQSTQPGFLTSGGATGLTCGTSAQGKVQVMGTGDLQYCDGEVTSLLKSGTLTPTGLRWNVTLASCTGDTNSGKLTVLSSGDIVCASDIGATAPVGGVTSVFGRTGVVAALTGDYTAAQVTNAADTTAANYFSSTAGQTMRALGLLGATSGTITLKAAAVAGSSTLTWPSGTTDFSSTGGPSQVLRQSTAGGPLTVAQLALTDLTGTSNLCTSSSVCPGYQAALTFGAGLLLTGATVSVQSTQAGFLTNGGSTALGCGTSTQGRMQILNTGELQYCDGALTALLHSGTLTPTPLQWNVTVANCTSDANGGKLTVLASGAIVCGSDMGGTGGAGGVTSVFGRTGAVVATAGDYSASLVTNAADLSAANTFTNVTGQSMRKLLLPGSSSGTLTVQAAAVAGVSTLTLPGGTTNLSTTGGASQVLRQSSAGAAITVGQLDLTDLTGASGVCTSASVCAGYQAALTFGAGLALNGTTLNTASTKTAFLTEGGTIALTCGAGNFGKMQVMSNGELQYCDGAVNPVLRSGLPTQSGLTWNLAVTSCTGDTNGGKLTVNTSNQIICASDVGGGATTGGVTSVFGRTGAVIANVGDYSASMVTSAADVTAANIFTNAAGQSMRALVLPGATSGSLTIKAAPVAGTGVLIFPAWSTDFTATGGPSQVLRQSATGGPLLVARLDFTDLTGTGNICTTGGICSGYQPVITWGPGLTYSGSTASVASTQVGFLTNGLSTGLTCGAGASGKMQVLTNGEFQYCDGGATAVLRSGLPTQSGLTWSATVSTCLGDTNGGKLTINSSNQIVCAADQGGGGGGGGSITAVGTCTSGACFTDTSPSTRLTYATSTAPAAPSAGKGTVYVDSTSRNLVLKDEVGLTKHGMQTVTAAASQYLTGLNDDGTVTRAQPTKTDVGLGNVDNTSDLTKNAATAVLTNKQVVPRVVLLSPLSNVVTPNADTTDTGYNYSLAAATTVANPTATPPNPQDQQLLELVFKTAAPQVLSWGLAFSPNCGLALPTGTTGDGVTYNHFLFSYHVDMAKWCLIATTKGPLNRVTTLSAAANFACPWSVSDQCQMKLTSGFTTLAIQAPTGANDGDMVLFLLQCQATATLTWDPAFIDSPNVTRPTSCPSTTWNTTWMVMGVRFSTDLGKYQILGTD